MLFTVLIYGVEGQAERLPDHEMEALLQKHRDLQARLKAADRYRGSVRLMGPSTAMTVRDDGGGIQVLDGPFLESKEQILGLYLIECASIEQAVEAARALPQGIARMEVRPVMWSGGLSDG